MKTLQHLTASSLSRIWWHIQNNAWGTISAFRKYRRDAYSIFTDEIRELVELGIARGVNDALDKIPEAQEYRISSAVNKTRHRLLMSKIANSLKVTHYTVAMLEIVGQYPEGGKSQKEKSLFIFHPNATLLKSILVKYGEEFEQDAVCFCAGKGKKIQEISTSPDDIDTNRAKVGTTISTFSGIQWGGTHGYEDGEIIRNQDGSIKEDVIDIFSSLKGRPFTWLGWEPVIDNTSDGKIESSTYYGVFKYYFIDPYGNYNHKRAISILTNKQVSTADDSFIEFLKQEAKHKSSILGHLCALILGKDIK